MSKKKAEITKAYIYEGAIQLFSKQGYENTTIRDLAKELNISLGSVYYHFKSKDDILIHYFRQLHEQTEAATAATLASNKASAVKVKAIIEANMDLLKENSAITKDLINATASLSHPLSPFGQELRSCQAGAIDMFRQALTKDHKPGEYLDALAFLYWFYYLGMCLCWANDSSKDSSRTETLKNITFPLTRKLITLTKIGLGRKLLVQVANLLRTILMKDVEA